MWEEFYKHVFIKTMTSKKLVHLQSHMSEYFPAVNRQLESK